jgi:hypothetical protein
MVAGITFPSDVDPLRRFARPPRSLIAVGLAALIAVFSAVHLYRTPRSAATLEISPDEVEYAIAQAFGDYRTICQDDAFYLPYAGLRGVMRPGPNLFVFKRRG